MSIAVRDVRMYLFRSEKTLIFSCSEGLHLFLSVWKDFFTRSVGDGTSSTSKLISNLENHK